MKIENVVKGFEKPPVLTSRLTARGARLQIGTALLNQLLQCLTVEIPNPEYGNEDEPRLIEVPAFVHKVRSPPGHHGVWGKFNHPQPKRRASWLALCKVKSEGVA